ncbi:Transcriptional regulatory ASH1 [Tubulinosema ratisbonensis]|uniref:Transcriptional regulatory ASH1 n=1 Tax=Tubulinosema ratisbonensis TaxID=291195 RepID=A0A437AP34_9MICR|nr:Transcriptional regulatory ASH1 [Tubulinosema ratisbonensis]
MSDDSNKNVEVRKRKRKFYKECCAEGCDFSEPFKMVPQKNVNQKEEVKIIKNPIFEEVSRRICKDKKRSNFNCTSCNTGITFYWRDGWDSNIILCNKCGLRFEKGRFYCKKCSYVPKKKEKDGKKCCSKCLYEW